MIRIRMCGEANPSLPQRLNRYRQIRRKKIRRMPRYDRHQWKRELSHNA